MVAPSALLTFTCPGLAPVARVSTTRLPGAALQAVSLLAVHLWPRPQPSLVIAPVGLRFRVVPGRELWF